MAEPTHDTDAAPRYWGKGNRFEDFTVGQQLEHHWGRTLSEADNTLFCTSTLTWLPLHLNADYARSQGHETVVLHPLLVFCTVLGLSVEDLSESGGAFLGVDDLHFVEPAYPGVTVYGRSTVLAMRESASRPTQGIVTWQTEGVDADGRLLIDFKRSNLIMRRDA
jgi:itaconyl-CoA hydratase